MTLRPRREITAPEGRAIVRARYLVPHEVRVARRALHADRRGDERTTKGVAQRSKDALVPVAS